MIIIIEGSDGTGKTTLAKYLCKKLNAHYLHATYRFKNTMFEYHTALLLKAINLIKDTHRPVIIDRHWVSEAVYAEVYRGGSIWGLQGRFVERVLNRVGGIHIFCLTEDFTTYKKRFKELKRSRNEMYDDVSEVAKLYNAIYWGNAPRSLFKAQRQPSYTDTLIHGEGMVNHINTLRYSIEHYGSDLNSFVTLVEEKLNTLRSSCPLVNHLQIFNGCGSPEFSSYLLIGDTPNPKGTRRRVLWPFYEYANSSLYLTEVLNELKVKEEDLFFVNINYTYGVEMIEVWLEYKRIQNIIPKIICMGNNAEGSFQSWFSKNIGSPFKGIDYFKTCHPQAARRFPKYGREFKRNLKRIFKRRDKK